MSSIHNLKAAASISADVNCCIFNFLLMGTEKNGFSTSSSENTVFKFLPRGVDGGLGPTQMLLKAASCHIY